MPIALDLITQNPYGSQWCLAPKCSLPKMNILALLVIILMWHHRYCAINPNTFAGVVGKVQKNISPRRKEGRVEKNSRPWDRGSNQGHTPCYVRVLNCTPQELFRQVSISVAIGRLGRFAQHHVRHVLEIVFVRFCKIFGG